MNNTNSAAMQEELEAYVRMITQPTPKAGKHMYICPLCHSGEGKNHTGAFHVFRHSQTGKPVYKCQKCGAHGDIFDLIGAVEGIASVRQRMNRAAEILHMQSPFDEKKENAFNMTFSNNDLKENTNEMSHEYTAQNSAETKTDYTEFINAAADHITETNYHRGLSLETLRRYNIGYVKEWRNPKAPSAPPMSCLIIPTSEYSFVARNTDPNAEKGNRYRKAGEAALFNVSAIDTAYNPIFLVEGEIDALSIIDVGGEAIGLGSTANADKLIQYVKDKHRPKASIIIALDNDEGGRAAANKLETAFKALGISYFTADYLYSGMLYGECKDANEMLEKDRNAFTAAVISASKKIAEKYQEEFSSAAYIETFLGEISDSETRPPISTGFPTFDKALTEGTKSPLPGEGFNAGLYIIGGESSVGKTTFALQIADQIARLSTAAEQGNTEHATVPEGVDVLIFSLEMGRSELMAKSISRQTIEYTQEQNIPNALAKSTAGILIGWR